MNDFSESFSFTEVRQMLWRLVHVAVTSENYFFQEFHQRDQLLLFYERLEQFLEAGFLLANQ